MSEVKHRKRMSGFQNVWRQIWSVLLSDGRLLEGLLYVDRCAHARSVMSQQTRPHLKSDEVTTITFCMWFDCSTTEWNVTVLSCGEL